MERRYGKDWFTWRPETLQDVFDEEHGGITPEDMDRLLAARNVVFYGHFYTDVDVFEAVVNAFNGVHADHRLSLQVSPGQILKALQIVQEIDDTLDELHEQVINYIATSLVGYALVWVPEEWWGISEANPVLDRYYDDAAFVDEVRDRWNELKDMDSPDFEDTAVDVQVARLIAMKQYADSSDAENSVNEDEDKQNLTTRIVLS